MSQKDQSASTCELQEVDITVLSTVKRMNASQLPLGRTDYEGIARAIWHRLTKSERKRFNGEDEGIESIMSSVEWQINSHLLEIVQIKKGRGRALGVGYAAPKRLPTLQFTSKAARRQPQKRERVARHNLVAAGAH